MFLFFCFLFTNSPKVVGPSLHDRWQAFTVKSWRSWKPMFVQEHPDSLPHVNTLIHLPLWGCQTQIFATAHFLIFMMTKANIACWIEWHRKVKLWVWLEGAEGNVVGAWMWMWACSLLRAPVHITGAMHTALFDFKHACKHGAVQQTIYMNLSIVDSWA